MIGDRIGLTRAIGFASIGLGLIDWTMAARFAERTGMIRGKPLFRAAGAREVLTGLAAIRAPDRSGAIVARLVGDAADLAILGVTAARRDNPRRGMAALGAAIVVAVALVDLAALRRGSASPI